MTAEFYTFNKFKNYFKRFFNYNEKLLYNIITKEKLHVKFEIFFIILF